MDWVLYNWDLRHEKVNDNLIKSHFHCTYLQFLQSAFCNLFSAISEGYSEPSQTSKMKVFAKPLTSFAECLILDAWLGSEEAFESN